MALSVCNGKNAVDLSDYNSRRLSGWRESENIQNILHFDIFGNNIKLSEYCTTFHKTLPYFISFIKVCLRMLQLFMICFGVSKAISQ